MPRWTPDQIADREEIREVIARYFRGVDRMDFDVVRSCFHPDAQDHHGVYDGDIEGFIAFQASSEALGGFVATHHAASNQIIDLADDRAHVETWCVAYHRTAPTPDAGSSDITVWFRYLDEVERRNGEWRIVDRLLVHDFSRIDRVDGEYAYPTATAHSARGRRDPIYRWLP